MAIEQIRVGFDNFSYVIHCQKSKKATIVDPGYDASKLLNYISSKNFELEYIIATHYHGDHTGGIRKIKNSNPSSKIVSSEADGKKMDGVPRTSKEHTQQEI